MIRLVQTPGGRVYVDEADQGSVARALISKGRYEKAWTRWMEAHVQPGMHVLDVGANIGYYTVLLAHLVGPTGSVVACEPDPHNFDLLSRTVAENGFAQVQLRQAAVCDRIGRATLYQDASWHGVHSLSRDNTVNLSDSSVEVATTTVDAVMSGIPRLDFVKLDAQGAELQILAGAAALLAQPRATVLMEVWPRGLQGLGGTVEEVVATFLQCGFDSYTLVEGGDFGPIEPSAVLSRAAALGQWSSFNVVWRKAVDPRPLG